MKQKLILALIMCFFSIPLSLYSQVHITMKKEDGVYKIPCKVNGVKMNFIFDTGASSVCLSLQMAGFLFDNGYLTANDFIGTGVSTVADGRIVNNMVVNLRDIEISGLHIYDVAGVIVESQSASLLLGQSAIQKLGKFSIDGNILTIWNSEKSTDLEALRTKAQRYEEKGLHHLSAPAWEEYYKAYWMTHEENDIHYAKIADNYKLDNNFSAAIKWYEQIGEDSDIDYMVLYKNIGECYFELGQISIARRYADLAKSMIGEITNDNWSNCSDVCELRYRISMKDEDFSTAFTNIYAATDIYVWGNYNEYVQNDIQDVDRVCNILVGFGKKDEYLASLVFRIAATCYMIGTTNECFCKYIKYAVQLGSSHAMEIYNQTEFNCSDQYKRIMNYYHL